MGPKVISFKDFQLCTLYSSQFQHLYKTARANGLQTWCCMGLTYESIMFFMEFVVGEDQYGYGIPAFSGSLRWGKINMAT